MGERVPWTPDTWNDGYPKGGDDRFMVYRPDYPNANPRTGEAKRFHVVYWLRTGVAVQPGMVIHHRNRMKLDDRFENLWLLTTEAHNALHAAERRARTALAAKRPAMPGR